MVQFFKKAFGFDKKVLEKTETPATVTGEIPKLLPQEAPTVIIYDNDITHDTVIVTAFGGFGKGEYEYGKNTEMSLVGFNYQASPVFKGLNPDTEYFFTARKKSDNVYEGSRLAARISTRTKQMPKKEEEKQFSRAV